MKYIVNCNYEFSFRKLTKSKVASFLLLPFIWQILKHGTRNGVLVSRREPWVRRTRVGVGVGVTHNLYG